MENFFLTEYFDWRARRQSIFDRKANDLLKRLGIKWRIKSAEFFDNLVNKAIRSIGPPRPLEPLRSIESGMMTNVEQRMNMYHFVSQVLAFGVPGDLVELGCFEGHSAVLFQKVIQHYDPTRKLHLYDSFEGLPEVDSAIDGSKFHTGQLATIEDKVRQNFRRYGLPQPEIHKGWFQETLPTKLPGRISFAHLDGDTFESILVSLEHVYPRLSPGAICLIDDYCDPSVNPYGWNNLPGVKKACDEFMADRPEQVSHIYSGTSSHGYFRKSQGPAAVK